MVIRAREPGPHRRSEVQQGFSASAGRCSALSSNGSFVGFADIIQPFRRNAIAQQFSVVDLSKQLRFGLLYLGGFDICRGPAPDHVGLFSVDSPGQQSVAVDRLFVVVVAVGGAARLRTWDNQLKIAMLPPEFSPVIRKRTARGPRRIISFEGFTLISAVGCAICASSNTKVPR